MERGERKKLKSQLDDLQGWVGSARELNTRRAEVRQKAEDASRTLVGGAVPVRRGGTVAWQVIPLVASDGGRLAAIARGSALPALTSQEQDILDGLLGTVAPALDTAQIAISGRRFVSGSKKRAEAEKSAD